MSWADLVCGKLGYARLGALGLTLYRCLRRHRRNRLRWRLWRDTLEKDLLSLYGLLHLRYLFERRRLRVFFQGFS